jgi:Holliday junction resolvasome RuvABC endonuclease subunit
MRVLGVDPGVAGGVALLASDIPGQRPGFLFAVVDDLPVVNRQINAGAWRRIVEGWKPDIAIVELVHSMSKQGVASTFKFGMACGLIRGVLLGAGVPIIDVAPTVWKKHFKLVGSDGEQSRALASKRFPALQGLTRKKDHNRAEALLIALWRIETDAV